MNPLSNLVSNFTNPKQIAMNMIMKNSGNPQINNLMNMINNNDTQGIKNMAEEVAQKMVWHLMKRSAKLNQCLICNLARLI